MIALADVAGLTIDELRNMGIDWRKCPAVPVMDRRKLKNVAVGLWDVDYGLVEGDLPGEEGWIAYELRIEEEVENETSVDLRRKERRNRRRRRQ
jgi:hypothetical protein